MTERPILFNGEMVRAILEGRKTQTRRLVKPEPSPYWNPVVGFYNPTVIKNGGDEAPGPEIFGASDESEGRKSPYGQLGDRLWVRETFCPIYPQDPDYNGGRPIEYDYAATYKHGDRMGDLIGEKKKWKPSIHMPRDACRLILEVTAVRVERLNDISEDDAVAEGFETVCMTPTGEDNGSAIYGPDGFAAVWDRINGDSAWGANPWVWVVEFKKLQEGSAALALGQDLAGKVPGQGGACHG